MNFDSDSDDNDNDSIFANNQQHPVVYINAICQAVSTVILNLLFYVELTLLSYEYLPLLRRRDGLKRKRIGNVCRDRSSVIQFIRSWDDTMFKRQFRMCREDFYGLEKIIMDHKATQGYDMGRHYKQASCSSGSPITLELRLFITMRLLSGASYLDMIWYGVSVASIPSILWSTICEIDEALDNIRFPTDDIGIMQLVDNWASKRQDRHGFVTNLGTALAIDGYVIEIKKPSASELNGKEVACFRNRKGFWGLITQVGCDSNGKVRFVQTDWPGATNDLSCFRETPLFHLLKSKQLPEWLNIVADEAYTPLSAECGYQILTPYSKHQLNTAKKQDWQNMQDWKARITENPTLQVEKPVSTYWKMRAFNHELSSERITIERVLGMVVRAYGILWRPIELELNKVPTLFRVICKLHNICMDRWIMSNPVDARNGSFGSVIALPNGDDENLWSTFDVSVGLDDGFEVPSYESVVERLENRYGRLANHRNNYTTRNIPRRDQLREELYALGVRFNPERESY